MNGFQFNLNRVLDVRSIEEKIAQNRLLQEKRKSNIIKDELKSLTNKQEEVYTYLREEGHNISIDETLQARSFIYRHRQTIKQVENDLDQQLEVVQKHQSEFIEKKKKKEILEKLKEKDFKKYQKELLNKEQKMIDELNQQLKGDRWSK